MTSAEEVGRVLERETEASRRTLYFSALLAQEAGSPEIVVVGGSAIEVYTGGAYVSGDIDIVGDRDRIAPVLARWGFEKGGRVWHHSAWKLVVDVPSSEYHGDPHRIRRVQTPFGTVRLAAVEDLVVSRLVSARYWERPEDFGQAVLLVAQNMESIDWEYVVSRASKERVGDLVEELRTRADSVTRHSHRGTRTPRLS